MYQEITILAPGLLGSSLARAIRDRRLARRISIWARRPEAQVECAAQPWCDAVFDSAEEAVKRADLVFVCTPVEVVRQLVTRIVLELKPGALVTDVGSAKGLIVQHCHPLMPTGTAFVGSHPMAGSEKSGWRHAHGELFCNRLCFVTPLSDTEEKAVETITGFWRSLDMTVNIVSPEQHDEIVANISHLPHILASVLCRYLATKDPSWVDFAGDGLRDSTRIASGRPLLWRGIIEQNRQEVLRALVDFEGQLEALKEAISDRQIPELLKMLEDGKAYRDRLLPNSSD